MKEHAKKNGSDIGYLGPQEFEAKLISDAKRWGDMVAEAGIQPE